MQATGQDGARPLGIGVNALYLLPGGVGGTEIYLRELLAALQRVDRENRYTVFTNSATDRDLVPQAPNFAWAPQAVRAEFRPARIVWEQTVLPWRVFRRGLDVLLNPGFTAPAAAPCPAVTVFHDLQHRLHPEYFRWFDRPFWRLLVDGAARRSTLTIAVSEQTRRDMAACYGLPPERIRVVEHGVAADVRAIAARRTPATPRIILYVATLHPQKNHAALLEAFARFRERRPGYRLVLVGRHGFAARAVAQRVAALGLGADVELTGWIPRAEVLRLYERAWCCVIPTLFEGFGMPLTEALAAGIPAACSAIEPLRALAGDAALLCDPESVESIAAALERVTEDDALRARLAAAGPARAARWSWDAAARETLAVLREAAGHRRAS
jgi:glycosyltransferase involved in cell wall biosynthesis